MLFPISGITAEVLPAKAKVKAKKNELDSDKQDSDKNKLLIASLCALGTAGLAALAIIKTKKIYNAKKTIHNVQQSERKVAEQIEHKVKAAEPELRNIQEEERIQTEKMLKQKAEKEAALKAEQEAEIKAVQAAKESKIHTEAIEKLNKISEMHNNSNIDLTMSIKNLKESIIVAEAKDLTKIGSTTNLTDEIIVVLKEAENTGIDISSVELKKILTDSMTNPVEFNKLKDRINNLRTSKSGEVYEEAVKSTEEFLEKYPNNLNAKEELISNSVKINLWAVQGFVNKTENKNTYLDNILNLIETNPKPPHQKTSEYLKDIITAQTEKAQAAKKSFDAKIKSMLSYNRTASDDTIILTKEERQQIADEFNKILKTSQYNADDSLGNMACVWKQKYISGYTPNLSERIEKALLQQFPKANPDKFYSNYNMSNPTVFEHIPVSRWMDINDVDGFLKQFNKEGCQYSYNKLQSCSVNYHKGENKNFVDWAPSYNIKLVMHPKGLTSKASTMGEGKYGEYEAIYPQGQKFKFLGKIKTEISHADFPEQNPFETFHRWEIHLQEL